MSKEKYLEIERKFLIARLPIEGNILSSKRIKQFYISINPEVRIRLINEVQVLITYKGEGTISRREIERPINIECLDVLELLNKGIVLEKNRYQLIDEFGQLWDIDEYKDEYEGLFIAELELKSEDQIINIPDNIEVVCELTFDNFFSNKSLAINPKISKKKIKNLYGQFEKARIKKSQD